MEANRAEIGHKESEQKNSATEDYPEEHQLTPELKEFIQEVVRSVSGNGAIVVEESLKTYINWEHLPGMKLDRGFISPYMMQNEDREETILEEPFILITNLTITKKRADDCRYNGSCCVGG